MNFQFTPATSSGTSLGMMEDEFTVLRKKEEEIYGCADYLAPEYQHKRLGAKEAQDPVFDFSPGVSSADVLDDLLRTRICEWCYEVVDHFEFSREVVDVCMSLLDRYLSKRKVTKKVLQLAAMASLNLALKIYEPGSFKVSTLLVLSSGRVTLEHMIAMEQSILQALEWHVSPPTIMSAIRYYLAMLNKDVDSKTRSDVEELAIYLSEVSVCDYSFVTKKPTSIALACILSSFTVVFREQTLCMSDAYQMIDTKIKCSIEEVHDCRILLLDLYQHCDYHGQKRTRSPDTLVPASGVHIRDDVACHTEFNDDTRTNGANDNNSSQFELRPVQIFSCYINVELMDE